MKKEIAEMAREVQKLKGTRKQRLLKEIERQIERWREKEPLQTNNKQS